MCRSQTYSITSSAATNSVFGTVRPSALAVFMLMTSEFSGLDDREVRWVLDAIVMRNATGLVSNRASPPTIGSTVSGASGTLPRERFSPLALLGNA